MFSLRNDNARNDEYPSYPPPAFQDAVQPQRTGRAWYPEYNAETEENRNNTRLNFVLFVALCVLPVAVGVCGWFLIRPGLVWQSVVPGNCTLETIKYISTESCGCGENCRSSYPCYHLEGTFSSSDLANGSDMVLYNSYWDYDSGCSFKECNRDESQNWYDVKHELVVFLIDQGYNLNYTAIETKLDTASKYNASVIYTFSNATEKISCYGSSHEDYSFIEYLDSTLFILCGCLPILLFVVTVVATLKCATPGLRFQLLHVLCFPYYFVVDRRNACRYACPSTGPLTSLK